jgi:hypothetical protein
VLGAAVADISVTLALLPRSSMRIAPGWVALPVNELPRTGGSQTSSE